MAENGYGSGPVAGYVGRIPNFGKTNVNPMGSVEPPACIQNAMMTKDKKPFTYTPGGLDLSQIRTPSMARRMARQRSLEEHDQQNNVGYHPQGGPHGGISQGSGPQGGVPPPPPPPKAPLPPPPPPPIVIQAPNSKSPKPAALGERPEIVIPENPIGMLRKTNSPYHWEAEKAELQKLGQVPKYVEKVPSPLTVKMPPSTFTQHQPQNYSSPGQNNFQRTFSNQNHPESPIHRPEAQYAHQKSGSPNVNGSPPTRELLQRQDSQFNKSPQPFATQSPLSNNSPYSPTPNNNWRQPERKDSPARITNIQQSPQTNRGPFSPNAQQYSPNFQNQSPSTNSGPAFHTLPRVGQRNQENINNTIYNNTQEVKPQTPQMDSTSAPWRTNTLNRYSRGPDSQQQSINIQNTNGQQAYSPPWKQNDANNNNESTYVPPWKQDRSQQQQQQQQQQQYSPPWVNIHDNNNNKVQETPTTWRSQEVERSPGSKNEQPRYQSTISIPVTPRKQNTQPEYNAPQKEAVYVNQEPVYYCPESPKSIPPWVKTQKEKTKTPPPVWCQRTSDASKNVPRELATPPRETYSEPEWVKKSNDNQRTARDIVSPPKFQQQAQPTWSTKPSENRKSLPKDNIPNTPGSRVIPIQMEVTTTETRDARRPGGNQQPQLRITIGMNPNSNDQTGVPFSPPTQRIMRVLSPQLVRLDDGETQHDLPTLNRSFQNHDTQPKTRIIPIQIEGGNSGTSKRVYYHKFLQEGTPRQSNAFKVLQIITNTQDLEGIQCMEQKHGYTDL